MVETNFPLKTPERIEAIKAWWAAFKDNESAINVMFSDGAEFDLVPFIRKNLDPISPEMMWEFGAGEDKNHRFVIAPEANRHLEPLATLMMDYTPDDLKYFEICLDRPYCNWEEFQNVSRGRLSWKTPDSIMFTATPGKHNLIDLVFYTQSKHQDDRTYSNCFIMAESLLGETTFKTWIGYVDVEKAGSGLLSKFKAPKVPPEAKPVSQLREAVAMEIAKVKNGLPQKPLCELVEEEDWLIVKMDPKTKSDYPKFDDMFVAPFSQIKPSTDLYSGQARFSSERYSALGETFIYVKVDGSADDLNQEVFQDKSDIEDALVAALKPTGLGTYIASGTGKKYSYIFLAVTDLDKAIPEIRKALQAGCLTRRSWILFNDVHREQEWIGIWDDTPEPPLPTYD